MANPKTITYVELLVTIHVPIVFKSPTTPQQIDAGILAMKADLKASATMHLPAGVVAEIDWEV